jgi:hypothetical protein
MSAFFQSGRVIGLSARDGTDADDPLGGRTASIDDVPASADERGKQAGNGDGEQLDFAFMCSSFELGCQQDEGAHSALSVPTRNLGRGYP